MSTNSQLKKIELAIIGGGAAGMFAAVSAARQGLPALLIERKARLGAKTLMTANGRCNFTRDLKPEGFLADLTNAAALFAAPALRNCPPREIIATLESLGVVTRRHSDARMFPADGKAATIVHAFGDELRNRELPILVNCPVLGLDRLDDDTFVIRTRGFDFEAKRVLLATGGVSYPKTGSVGDGQRFAQALGHTLVPYAPGLIGLETTDRRVTRHAGRRFEDGRVTVADPGGHQLFDYRGEVDCESFGLSGAAIYNAQRFLEHYRRDYGNEAAAVLMLTVSFERERLQFQNLRSRPLKEAIVTIGGVKLDEVEPATCESRLVKGLYFAGELLDLDGPTGGYNLTLAFATARLAVETVARELGLGIARAPRLALKRFAAPPSPRKATRKFPSGRPPPTHRW